MINGLEIQEGKMEKNTNQGLMSDLKKKRVVLIFLMKEKLEIQIQCNGVTSY